ncbi:MAG: hypothetical protein D6762_03700 [Candidatus Neomarinimicrobiota bacterium]|nr:MAG: hypothetical protein D6762_03700 [Candidatus Neomarinimicrobiota bacterium]
MDMELMKKFVFVLGWLPILLWGQYDPYALEENYGGGIGYSPMYIALDSIPGSASLRQLGLDPNQFASPFVLQGGEGFAQISGRWRIGGYAGIGSSRISAVPTVTLYLNRDGVEGYQAPPAIVPDWSVVDSAVAYTGSFLPSIRGTFTFALGAAGVEYAMPLFRDLELAAGALMGLGRINLSVDQTSGTPRWSSSFSSMYGDITDSTLYYQVQDVAELTSTQTGGLEALPVTSRLVDVGGTFFNFQPYVALKWQVLDRVGLRLSVGFNKGSLPAGGWTLNNSVPISDSPAATVQGLAFRTMLYFGL